MSQLCPASLYPSTPCTLAPSHQQQLTLSLQQLQQLGGCKLFWHFLGTTKTLPQCRLSAKMFSKMKMKSLKENRTEMLQLKGQLWGMCWNARLIKGACPTFAARSDQFFCSLRHFWLFILSMFCVVLWPGLLLLFLLLVVCRSLRYYFAIHFCLTQFQCQFQFQFQLPAFYYYLKNEMKRNETLQCKLNADAGNFLLTFSSLLVFGFSLFWLTQKENETKKETSKKATEHARLLYTRYPSLTYFVLYFFEWKENQ